MKHSLCEYVASPTAIWSGGVAAMKRSALSLRTPQVCFMRRSLASFFMHLKVRCIEKSTCFRKCFFLELLSGFGPETSSLPRMRSTDWAIAASVFRFRLGYYSIYFEFCQQFFAIFFTFYILYNHNNPFSAGCVHFHQSHNHNQIKRSASPNKRKQTFYV